MGSPGSVRAQAKEDVIAANREKVVVAMVAEIVLSTTRQKCYEWPHVCVLTDMLDCT